MRLVGDRQVATHGNAEDGYQYISGPGCFICDECVEVSNEIIAEEVEKEATET